MKNPPEFISKKQLSKTFGIPTQQIDRMVKRGELPPPVPISDRITCFVKAEIDEWISQRVEQRAELLAQRRSPNPLAKENRKSLLKRGRV